ncbi:MULTISPECIES: hypothetical protein [unclassified Pseudomonas]|uniref:hypothetical protein n=1 Tax=unclassified Pseudomonas TaxID=196821 RepID=UPI0012FD6821|nr:MULTISPECIES: hypothetical protein [unclassified Pseudomonas]MCU1737166.1 hypothetical protein [Pseudomonas sp. 20S_6.2_Bac1]
MPSSKKPSNSSSDGRHLQVDPQKPTVPAVLDPDDPEGLLPSRVLGDPLEVQFWEWSFGAEGRTDKVELGFRPVGLAFVPVDEREYVISYPIDIPFPQSLYVPPNRLSPDGLYDVSIRISVAGGNPLESPKKQVTIDTTAPNFGQQPDPIIFPADANGVITEDYLTAHGGEVNVEVPFYTDAKGKDRAIYYWTDTPTPSDLEVPIDEQEFSVLDVINKKLRVTYRAEDIRPWRSGVRYAYYYLRDWAGNPGPRSKMSPIDVDLTPAPGTLNPPRVELVRGLVDRQQARDTVWVEIDQYDDADAAHFVAILWDGTPLPEFPVNPAGFPLKAPVEWAILKAQGLGPLRARVDYRIRTAGGYTPPSPGIGVPVNLSIAGQDHIAAPGLINADLEKLQVWGQENILNTLTGLDEGQDARATVRLFDDPEPYEELLVYWGQISAPVGSYTVQPGDFAGKLITIPIPWSAIEQDKSNPTLPVYYITSNGVNEQQSLVTEVNVMVDTIKGLPEVKFPSATAQGYLNCCSRPRLWEGVRVLIEGNVNFSANDTVLVIWQGHEGLNGTDPIKGVRGSFTKILSATEAVDGFEVLVEPYESLIAPMVSNGSAVVFYRLIKTTGRIGISRGEFVKITRTMAGSVCDPTNDICME